MKLWILLALLCFLATIAYSSPSVSLDSPQDGAAIIASDIFLNFTPSSTGDASLNCILTFNSLPFELGELPSGAQQYVYISTLENPDNYWSVSCSDSEGTFESPTYSFTVTEPKAPAGGGASNFTPQDVAGWSQTYVYSGSSWDFAYSAQQTSDGGYILAGYTRDSSTFNADVWLVKTDSSGTVQWNKTYGGIYEELAYSAQQTSDGGYILAGDTNAASFGQALLIKTNSNGDMQWNRTYGSSGVDYSRSAQQTSDGGYILAGTTNSSGAGSSDFWLVKTDSDGTMEWNRTFGGTGNDDAKSVQQTSDGGYILAGLTNSSGAGDYDFYLVKTDSSGTMEWNKTYGGSGSESAYSAQQTSDGGYILAGYNISLGGIYSDAMLVKTDSSGTVEWNKTYGAGYSDRASSVQQTSDGGYIFAGIASPSSNIDCWLVKTDSSGTMEWNRTYGVESGSYCESVQNTTDGGYILGGYTGSSDYHYWLIKVAPADVSVPSISLLSPANTTYGTTSIPLNYTAVDSGGISRCWYSLNGGTNTTLSNCANTSITAAQGANNVRVYANDTSGNLNSSIQYFTVNSSVPTVAIQSPVNSTYGTTSIPLNYTATDPDGISQCWYSLNVGTNQTLASCANTSVIASGGANNVRVYANDTLGNLNSAIQYFTVNSSVPTVAIQSPANTTYGTSTIPLNFIASNPDKCWYSLDSGVNISLPGCANTTLMLLSEGPHQVDVYANDTAGNNVSDSVSFSFANIPLLVSIIKPANSTALNCTPSLDFIALSFADEVDSCWYSLDGGADISLPGCANSSIPYISVGAHMISVYANDSMGILGSDSKYFSRASGSSVMFNAAYNGTNDDIAYSVQQTTDGGYISAGVTNYDSYHNLADAWLVKTYSNGTMEWNRTFGGAGMDQAYSVKQTPDGGYILAGETSSFGAGSSDFWLIKTYSNGTMEWNRTFGGTGNDASNSAKQTSDGGYILAGYTTSFGAGGSDFWLVKTYSNGTMEWNQTYGGASSDEAESVQQTADGGYILAGYANDDAWLVKTDSIGTMEWNQTFGGIDSYRARSVQQTTDGGYVIAGSAGGEFWLLKIDSGGTQQWSKIYHGPGSYTYANSAQQTTDGGYILFGYAAPSGAGSADAWLVKTDSNGTLEWNQTFGGNNADVPWGSNADVAWSGQQTSDGGYILAGYTGSAGSGGSDFWLVKVIPPSSCSVNPALSIQSPANNTYLDCVLQLNFIVSSFFNTTDSCWYSLDGGADVSLPGCANSSIPDVSFGAHMITVYANDSTGILESDSKYFSRAVPPSVQVFNATYGGPGWDMAWSTQETNDGGYIIAGTTDSFGAGGPDFWLVKTDSDGTMEWNKTYGGIDYDEAHFVQQTSDGGYILAGMTRSFGAGDFDFWLVKTDSSGTMEWNRTFGGAYDDRANSVRQTSDGGYILFGNTGSAGAGALDFWLVKTDSSGTMVWSKTYGRTGHEYGTSVQQTTDGGYILAGISDGFESGNYDAWLVKTDSSGTMEWNKSYGGYDFDYASFVQQTSDGGYIFAGQSDSVGAGGDAWLVKIDSNGTMEWSRGYGGPSMETADSVQQTSDGGYIFAGEVRSFGAGAGDFWLVKTYSDGTMAWNKTYGGAEWDHADSVQQTSDGGYILAGYTTSFGAGGYDFWLVKAAPPSVCLVGSPNISIQSPLNFTYSSCTPPLNFTALPNPHNISSCWYSLDGGENISLSGCANSSIPYASIGAHVVSVYANDTLGNNNSASVQFSMAASISLNKTYGGENDDYAYSAQQTADGGYIIAGYTYSYDTYSNDFYLVKTDSSGTMEWNKTYGGDSDDYAYSAQQTADGGYIIAGYTYSYDTYTDDFYLVKTDSGGTMEWSQAYDAGSDERAYSAQQTADGGYIIAGYTYSYDTYTDDFYLVKTDSSGNMEWSQAYGGSDDERAYSAQQTTDGGYILAGYTWSSDSESDDFYIVKTDSSGNMEWSQAYDGGSDERASSVQQTTDGGYILAGYTFSSDTWSDDFYLVKTDSSGNMEWGQAYGADNDERANSVQQTSDGGYILAGYTFSSDTWSDDFWLLKVSPPSPSMCLVGLSVSIQSPLNSTYSSSSLDFNFSAEDSIGISACWYSLDSGENLTLPGCANTTLSGLSEGPHQVELYANNTIGNNGSDSVSFSLANLPPSVSIIEPANDTYSTCTPPLSFTVSSPARGVDSCWHSLDGGANISLPGCANSSIPYASIGPHLITVYANDSSGNIGSGSQYFSRTAVASASVIFDATYGGANSDYARSAQQTADGGYILAGSIYSGTYDGWLVKTDSNGTAEWDQAYGVTGYNKDDEINSVQQTSDGGYILFGYTTSYGAGDYNFWLVKTNSTGGMQWNKTYGGSSTEYGNSVQQTTDGGYILAGYTGPYYDSNFWLVKINSTGGMQWNNTYGGAGSDRAYSVQQTSDGGYIIAGSTESFGAAGIYLVKTDSSGTMQWNQTYGGWGDIAYSVKQTTDGGYILAGQSNSFSAGGDADFYLVKTDSSGTMVWDKTFGGADWDYANSVQQTSDGGYIVSGTTESMYGWVVKTDASGEAEWDKKLGSASGEAHFAFAQQTADGNYMIAGRMDPGSYNTDFWLVKLAPPAPSVCLVSPTLSIQSPLNSTYSSPSLALNYSAEDPSGISACWYSLDSGTNITLSGCENTTLIGLSNGPHQVEVHANNTIGNNASASVSFSIVPDTAPPLVSILEPSNVAYNSSSLALNYTASDDSGISACWHSLDSGINVSLPGCANTSLSGLAEGAHSITLYANDTLGNANSSSVSFSVDATGPAISIISPANTTYGSGAIPLNYTATDPNLDRCWYFLDGGINVPLPGCANTSLIGLGDGAHNIILYANDTLGNFDFNYVIFSLDNLSPLLSLISPTNTTYGSSTVDLNYTVSDPNLGSCWHSLDSGGNVPLPGCANTSLSGLADGAHSILLHANDTLGNDNSASVTFSIATESIDVFSISPEEGYSTNVASNTFTWKAVGDFTLVDCELIIDSSTVFTTSALNNTEYSSTNVLGEGAHTWFVHCSNEEVEGQSAPRTIFIYSEPRNPGSISVALNSPATGVKFNISELPITLSYTMQDSNYATAQCSLYVNGHVQQTMEADITASESFSFSGNEGTYIWRVQCIDAGGNFNSSDERTFSIVNVINSSDSTVPVVHLIDPINGFTTNEHTLAGTFSATDNDPILSCTVAVYEQYARFAKQVWAVSSTSTEVPFDTLEDGTYFWNATCLDNGGNQGASETWMFVIGPNCGDGVCTSGVESCSSCSTDCGICGGGGGGGGGSTHYCDDGTCNSDESCATCSVDCGICQAVCVLDTNCISIQCCVAGFCGSCACGADGVCNSRCANDSDCPPVCISDSDCPSGQQCLNSICTIPPICIMDGTCNPFCIIDPDCPISCTTDSQCPPGAACFNSTCVVPEPGCEADGACNSTCIFDPDCPITCTSDSQCPPGAACFNSTCVVPEPGCEADGACNSTCIFDPDCPTGCTSDFQCQLGETCINSICVSIEPICTADGLCNLACAFDPDCPPCSSDADCLAGQACQNGTCMPVPGCSADGVCNSVCPSDPDCPLCTTNSDCQADQSCQSGTCTGCGADGTCNSACLSDPDCGPGGKNGTQGGGGTAGEGNATGCAFNDPPCGDCESCVSNSCVALEQSVQIEAPLEAELNTSISVRLLYMNNSPVTGAKMSIENPSQVVSDRVTEKDGSISYIGKEEGYYTYAIFCQNLVITRTLVTSVYDPSAPPTNRKLVLPLYVTEPSQMKMEVVSLGKPVQASVNILQPAAGTKDVVTSSVGTYNDMLATPGKYIFTISASNVRSLSAKIDLFATPATGGLFGSELLASSALAVLIIIAIVVGYVSRKRIVALLRGKNIASIRQVPPLLKEGEKAELFFTDSRGKPIKGAAIRIVDEKGESISMKTDEKGRLVFIPEAKGTYLLFSDSVVILNDKLKVE